MSRIGRQPVIIPEGVTVQIKGSEVVVKGPLGELTQRFHPSITIKQEDGQLMVTRPTDQRQHRALHGLTRALLDNMVTGVSKGYRVDLEIVGTGYRAEMQGDSLKLSLGYSHDVLVEPPPGMKFQVEERGRLVLITCHDKQLLGQVVADIRKLRPPEPYKGKGIRFAGEVIRQKAGKAGKTGG
jgi:large subunit ribosomal protein L6